MGNFPTGDDRPSIHLPASESDRVASLALQIEHRQPAIAAMLLQEIDRAEIYDEATLPSDSVILGSRVDFVDDNTHQLRKITLVLPPEANIAEGRISILTPMGAALYGLREGSSINWPDRSGMERRITIVHVEQPRESDRSAPVN